MTSTNLNPKNRHKKWIYIGAGIVILIVGGLGFWFWNKSKNKSDPTNEQDDYKDSPVDIKEWRSREWKDEESGYGNYKIPPLPKNISESRAKDEVLEWIWQMGSKKWDKKKLERYLEKTVKKINLTDRKKYGKMRFADFIEKQGEKYQSKIFFNQPDQNKLESGIRESQIELFFLVHAFFSLELKNNKEIDWKASLEEITARKKGEQEELKKREELEEINERIEREIYPTIAEHAKKFPNLTTLVELNQWSKVLARKQETVERLICYRWFLSKRVNEKIPSPKEGFSLIKDSKLKNKKFGLEPVFVYYKLREDK